MKEFKPPTDPALHALWVIRNWTRPPDRDVCSMQSWEDRARNVHKLAAEVFEQLTKEEQK